VDAFAVTAYKFRFKESLSTFEPLVAKLYQTLIWQLVLVALLGLFESIIVVRYDQTHLLLDLAGDAPI